MFNHYISFTFNKQIIIWKLKKQRNLLKVFEIFAGYCRIIEEIGDSYDKNGNNKYFNFGLKAMYIPKCSGTAIIFLNLERILSKKLEGKECAIIIYSYKTWYSNVFYFISRMSTIVYLILMT